MSWQLLLHLSLPWLLLLQVLTASLSSGTDGITDDFRCSVGHFLCGNLTECVPQRLWCEGTEHCSNGEDELPKNCRDNNGGWMQSLRMYFNAAVSRHRHSHSDFCESHMMPAYCSCNLIRRSGKVVCSGSNYTLNSERLPVNLTRLLIQESKVTVLQDNLFTHFQRLTSLSMLRCSISTIMADGFKGLHSLKTLSLANNQISWLQRGTFEGMEKLKHLLLQYNSLRGWDKAVFLPLTHLYWIDLRNNKLSFENVTSLDLPSSVSILDLENNHIRALSRHLFSSLTRVTVLILKGNQIEVIEYGAFNPLQSIMELDLSDNLIATLPDDVFAYNSRLLSLSLEQNLLTHVNEDTFKPLTALTSLNLSGMHLKSISKRHFETLGKLEFIEFISFRYCRYAQHIRVCSPTGDGISSIDNLLEVSVMRMSIWVIAIISCLGNIAVLIFRSVMDDGDRSNSLIIRNLCAADLLMSFYLFSIASHDLYFRDEFNLHADSWLNSVSCQVSGIVAMTSSEVSLLILTLIALERYYIISCPYRFWRLHPVPVMIILAFIWISGIFLSIMPMLMQTDENSFYGNNGLCFPLHIHDPFTYGWEWSTFIFIGINMAAILVIIVCYSRTLSYIYKTRKTAGRNEDVRIAYRFLGIIFTDALCWIPLAILKIIALNNINIPEVLYSWMAVCILPMNSAINPLLYTLTTLPFRSKFLKIFKKSTDVQIPLISTRHGRGISVSSRCRSESGSYPNRQHSNTSPSAPKI